MNQKRTPLSVRVNDVLWGKFIEQLKLAGVVIAHTKTKKAYLRRELPHRIAYAVLPAGFDEKNPDASGEVGCAPFYSICRNLEIDKREYFKGWYMDF